MKYEVSYDLHLNEVHFILFCCGCKILYQDDMTFDYQLCKCHSMYDLRNWFSFRI